jgi:hypothetical protein
MSTTYQLTRLGRAGVRVGVGVTYKARKGATSTQLKTMLVKKNFNVIHQEISKDPAARPNIVNE